MALSVNIICQTQELEMTNKFLKLICSNLALTLFGQYLVVRIPNEKVETENTENKLELSCAKLRIK